MTGECLVLYLISAEEGKTRGFIRVEEEEGRRLLEFCLREGLSPTGNRYQVWLKTGQNLENRRFVGELLVDPKGRARGRWWIPPCGKGEEFLILAPSPGEKGEILTGKFPRWKPAW